MKAPYLSFVKLNRKSATPLFQQLSNQLSNAIQRNYIEAGTKLPGTRTFSQLLQVNRSTVIAAYEELNAQGWTESIANKGTFVATKNKEEKKVHGLVLDAATKHQPQKAGYHFQKRSILDTPYENIPTTYFFTDGTTDIRLTALHQLSALYSANLKRKVNQKKLTYPTYGGSEYYRKQLANYLNITRGLQINYEQILATRSNEMGLYIATRTLLSPNDHIAVAALGHFSTNMTFQSQGVKVHTVGIDEEGILPEDVEALCQQQSIRLVYVTPHHHYPTTVTLSTQRRVRLLQLAKTYGFILLEDDYDYDFHYEKNNILPLASADQNGMVVYIGTFGRSLPPGFRSGFICAPAEVIVEMKKHLALLDPQGDLIMEQVLGELIEEGTITRELKKAKKIYQDRRNHFCQALTETFQEQVKFTQPSGGLAVWTAWQGPINLWEVRKKAITNDLFLSQTLLYQSRHLTAMRLGFGHLTKEEMDTSLALLKKAMEV